MWTEIPPFESSRVLYFTPPCTSSMQELIKQGMKQKLEKSCFRCKKNTWHVEFNYLLQPPKYLIIVVNRLRYFNNNFAKDKCSIPMDMTVVLGLHKFSLQATIDHHGPSMYSGHYTASLNCCKRTFYCNDNKITEFKTIDIKNSSTAYVVMYNWLHNGLRTRTGGWEFWLLPWRWHILSIPLKAGGWCVSSWRPWFWPVHSIYYIRTTHYSRILTN